MGTAAAAVIVRWAVGHIDIRHVRRRIHDAICKTLAMANDIVRVRCGRAMCMCVYIPDSTKAKQYVKKAIYFNHLGGSVEFPVHMSLCETVRGMCVCLCVSRWQMQVAPGQTDIFSFNTIETSSQYLRTIPIPITIE